MKQKIRVMAVFGTRPEAIKMAPPIIELKQRPGVECTVCVTAQHRQMLDSVLQAFNLSADYDLDIMKQQQTLTDIVSNALSGLDNVFKTTTPDVVLVHGDTSTTFVASLAAFYNKIKVGHVEAGLRTFDKYSPFPEEMNRKLTAGLSDFHFAPTQRNYDNLVREGIDKNSIWITGNTVIDALKTTVKQDFSFSHNDVNQAIRQKKRVILMTAHRRENLGQPLINIFSAVRAICDEFEDICVIYPVHLNPAVKQTADQILGDHPRIRLIQPLDVVQMHNLMSRSFLVLTDSGGIQEEAPSLGKPVLVLRKETERPEAVEAGTVRMAGIETQKIYEMTKCLLTNQQEYDAMAKAVNPYGDGLASKRIADCIEAFAKGGE